MAESAVSFLIAYLGPLLVDEAKLLRGVHEEARSIRDELERMRSFLRDADAREDGNESIKTWVRQVRDAAYETEAILDEFILCIGQHNPDGGGVFGVLHKMAQSIKQLKARHRVARQIRDMRTRLSDISKRKDDYNLNSTEQVSSLSSLDDGIYDPRVDALFTEESELVEIEGPRARLISWLLKGEQRLSKVSVVGMGGLGKTTLVKKVYDSDQVKKHFETFSWVTVSQRFNKKDLLQNMITQFYEANKQQAPRGLDGMTDIQLIKMLRDYLDKKRFVLVVDDIWEIDVWNFLRRAWPGLECGSRVMLTMRSRDVASSCCNGPSDFIYDLPPLNPNTALSLFCRRAFPAIEENRCPPGLEKLARSFVEKCSGLPLAIVTIGGLLASKDQTYGVWEMMQRSLGVELERDQLRSMKKILWLSFNELPYHLKSCFSYLGIFPEAYDIRRTQIIELWKAEGFLEEKQSRTREEVGESYFKDLCSRSLIQVSQCETGGDVLTFRIHDLLRDIIISKSGEENRIESSNEKKIAFSDRVRRLSIYNKGDTVPQFESSPRLRSFFLFGVNRPSITSAISSFAGFRLLKAVTIENIPLESFPTDLTSLLHLRYINLRRVGIKHLPSSVGKLTNLETLVLEDTFVCELPVEICKLQRLCTLFVSCSLSYLSFRHVYGAKIPSGVGSLRSLQELSYVHSDSCVVRELGKLTQLRILRISKLRREDGHHLCTALEKMENLKILEVTSVIEEDEEMDFHSLSCPPQTLQQVSLCGHLKALPRWIGTLQNLCILRLFWSMLEDDPLKALGSLTNLVQLRLMNAYNGEELCVKEGNYPKLKELCLRNLRGLKKVTVEKGAMSNLEILSIECCEVLLEVPCWLGHLTNLKRLFLEDMPMTFLNSLQSDVGAERAAFIQHIPIVNHYDSLERATCKF